MQPASLPGFRSRGSEEALPTGGDPLNTVAQLALLALTVPAWLAAWPLVVALTPGRPAKVQLEGYMVGGYSVITLWGVVALVTEPVRFQLSAAPGPATVSLMYAYFGYMGATSVLMARVGAPIRSLWLHHGAFTLLPLFCVFGDYWVEVYAWLLTTQFTGALHSFSRLAQRYGTPDQVQLAGRLEWFGLVAVRGVFTSVVTIAFVLGEVAHPTYPGVAWRLGLGALVLVVVAFPLFWVVPVAKLKLRRWMTRPQAQVR
jgi:hypothetical protein